MKPTLRIVVMIGGTVAVLAGATLVQGLWSSWRDRRPENRPSAVIEWLGGSGATIVLAAAPRGASGGSTAGGTREMEFHGWARHERLELDVDCAPAPGEADSLMGRIADSIESAFGRLASRDVVLVERAAGRDHAHLTYHDGHRAGVLHVWSMPHVGGTGTTHRVHFQLDEEPRLGPSARTRSS